MTKEIKPLNEKVENYDYENNDKIRLIDVEDVKNKTNRVKERLKDFFCLIDWHEEMGSCSSCDEIDKIFQEEIGEFK